MKSSIRLIASILAIALAPLFASAQVPAASPAPQDQTAVILALRSQRDQITSAMQDAQIQITVLNNTVQALSAKNAELQKKLDELTPKPAASTPPAPTNPAQPPHK